MTTFRQIVANRRNALKSTGPITSQGKQRSRKNAVRHGLTAETVIGALEDAHDYKSFQAAVIADYDAKTAVERELILRLASLLWRLRRSTTIETGLFEIQAAHLNDFRRARRSTDGPREATRSPFSGAGSSDIGHKTPLHTLATKRWVRNSAALPIQILSNPMLMPQSNFRAASCVSPICQVTH